MSKQVLAGLSSHTFLANVWKLAKPYWSSEEKWVARGLLLTIITLSLGSVYLSVMFNEWNGQFYNALQEMDVERFTALLFKFCWLAALAIAAAVYEYYLTNMLHIRWRRWLTDVYFKRWLDHNCYYLMELQHESTDNPDQRIAEDIRDFTDDTLSLSLGLMNSVVTLFSFVTILWGLSGEFTFEVASVPVTIPGFMVWVALLYAILGTWLAHKVGFPLVKLNFLQQRYEADFRFAMVRLRENAEEVALYHGEKAERKTLGSRFANVWQNYWQIMKYQKRLIGFTAGYTQLAMIFPILVAAPRYFSGAIQLGGMMQVANAFGMVQGAMSWFVDNYSRLARWHSVVDRLTGFAERLDGLEQQRKASTFKVQPEDSGCLRLQQMAINLPSGERLLAPQSLTLEPGENVLVKAPSGTGKSTLFRALAGIWPWCEGSLGRPQEILFLPQIPYLPVATLKQALTYPEPASECELSDRELIKLLVDCRLKHFTDRLYVVDHWAHIMSPGEQQRLAIARALLRQPKWLFLDEATAALDSDTEAHLYQLLVDRLPDCSLISIAHRASVERFHQHCLTLQPGTSGAQLQVSPMPA